MSTSIKNNRKWAFIEAYQYLAYFCLDFVDADLEGITDEEVAAKYASEVSLLDKEKMFAEAGALLAGADFPWIEVADCANRYFESPYQCREWLVAMLKIVETVKPNNIQKIDIAAGDV